jgi:hypothetical protein
MIVTIIYFTCYYQHIKLFQFQFIKFEFFNSLIIFIEFTVIIGIARIKILKRPRQ